ncbi:alpha/beta fold hydrolase [Kribbella sp. CA-247076]|uniref:alpha/beta fold hydrolase n=1 Tax=Kribbella sp. CA-247076 TaxID=3239941 RepID=UPI003D927EB3
MTESGRLAGTWYMAVGDGPPLVYLPPFGIHNKPLEGWQQKASLRAVAGLARHFRVYWINRKEGLAAGATVADLAGDAAAAIQERFTEPVDVLGYSHGALVSLALAADRPQLVRRLVVGGLAHRLTPAEQATCANFVRAAEAGRPRAAVAALARGAVENPLGRTVVGALAWLAGPAGAGRSWDPHDAVVALRAVLDADLADRLPSIHAPTLLIAGERDVNCPPTYVAEMLAALPDAQAVRVPGKGHGGTMLAPAFTAEIMKFLT